MSGYAFRRDPGYAPRATPRVQRQHHHRMANAARRRLLEMSSPRTAMTVSTTI